MRGAKQFVIGLSRHGCKNRPFYHIDVTSRMGRKYQGDVVEQVGTFDPFPNERNEKLVGLNIERIKYYIAKDAIMSVPVMELLGLSGLLPVHPLTYLRARKAPKERAWNDKAVKEMVELPPLPQARKQVRNWRKFIWRYKA